MYQQTCTLVNLLICIFFFLLQVIFSNRIFKQYWDSNVFRIIVLNKGSTRSSIFFCINVCYLFHPLKQFLPIHCYSSSTALCDINFTHNSVSILEKSLKL